MSRHRTSGAATGILVSAALMLGCTQPHQGEPREASGYGALGDVVARVNGSEIRASALQRARVDLLALDATHEADSDHAGPTEAELNRAALESLIQRELLLQEAGRRGLKADEDEIDTALITLRNRFTDLQDLGQWMQQRGLTDESLMRTLREDALTRQLTAALVEELGESPDEHAIEAFYQEHKTDLVIGQEVRLQIIAVASARDAEDIAAALRDGESFSRLARERSLGLRASMAGLTDWVALHSLEPPLQRVVARLEEGEAFGPIKKSDDEFLIVALTGRRAIVAESLDAAREKIEQHLKDLNRRAALQEWMMAEYGNADVERYLWNSD